MGKRRIRNLQYLGYKDIIGCDVVESRRKDVEKTYSIKTCSSIDQGFEKKPDAVIISTPPGHHYDIAQSVANKGLPFFMEANVIPEGFEQVMVPKC